MTQESLLDTVVSNTVRKPVKREFVGHAWINKVKGGKSYINVRFDKGVPIANLNETCTMQLWGNAKRDGKRDADLRVSILRPEVA